MIKWVFAVLAVLFLFSGCSPGRMAVSTSDLTVRYDWQPLKVDRYEPVVFPAGQMD